MHVRPASSVQAAGKGLADLEIVNAGPLAGITGAAWTNYKTAIAQVGALLHARYGAVPGMVSFEVFNEPPTSTTGWTGTPWAAMAVDLVATVRNACPSLTLWVGGDGTALTGNYDYGATLANGLLALNGKLFDGNVGFVHHNYNPAPFCFQATQGAGGVRPGLPFQRGGPPDTSKQSAAIATMTANVNADEALTSTHKTASIAAGTSALNSYYAIASTSYTDPSNGVTTTGMQGFINKYHGQAPQWADNNNVARNRVWLGEFGATAGTVQGNKNGLAGRRTRPLPPTSQRSRVGPRAWCKLGRLEFACDERSRLHLGAKPNLIPGRRAGLGLTEA